MSRIAAIARNAFREAVRDRVLYNLVLFVLLLILSAIFLGELSAAQEVKIITDLGLSAILIFGVFIAIFIGVALVYKEIERRTIYAIFAKPVTRSEFLTGKYLGLCLTILVNVAIMGAGLSLALCYVQGGWNSMALTIWPAVAAIYLELAVVVAVALLFSSFSSPALAALFTFGVFIIGHFSGELHQLANSVVSPLARYFFQALYYILPNLSEYSYITPAAHGTVFSLRYFLALFLYALIYIAALLSAATIVLNRRNFK